MDNHNDPYYTIFCAAIDFALCREPQTMEPLVADLFEELKARWYGDRQQLRSADFERFAPAWLTRYAEEREKIDEVKRW